MAKKIDEHVYDVRTVERHVRSGLISKKDYEKFLASIEDSAVQAAKNELIESLAPSIRTLVEKNLKGAVGTKNEDTDRIRRGVQDNAPGESHTGFEEGKKNKVRDSGS